MTEQEILAALEKGLVVARGANWFIVYKDTDGRLKMTNTRAGMCALLYYEDYPHCRIISEEEKIEAERGDWGNP